MLYSASALGHGIRRSILGAADEQTGNTLAVFRAEADFPVIEEESRAVLGDFANENRGVGASDEPGLST